MKINQNTSIEKENELEESLREMVNDITDISEKNKEIDNQIIDKEELNKKENELVI